MSKTKKSMTEVPKEYPSVKTIILRENHPDAKKEPTGVRLGVWSYDLEAPITLKDGDQVLLKSSFVDTNPAAEGLITVSDDEVAALSLTTGLYWQDSGCGQDIQRFAKSFDGGGGEDPVYENGLGFVPNGPLPRMSQVLQSEGKGTTPNARNYICQNTTDDFGNTILYLNTPTALQDGGGSVRSIVIPTATKPYYVTEKNVRTVAVGGTPPAGGMDLRVDIVAGTPASPGVPAVPGNITQITINEEFSRGYGYPIGTSTVTIEQEGVTAANLEVANVSTTASAGETDASMAVEFIPNEAYNPGSAAHEWNDYTLGNAVDTLIPVSPPNPATAGYPTVWENPGVTYISGIPVNELNRVSNICQLKVQTDPTDNSIMYIYSHDFSQGDGAGNGPFPATGTPDPDTQSIAKMVHSVQDDGQPIFSIIRNNNWDLDATLYGGAANVPANHIEQGWIFASTVATNPITFNGGKQPSFYRICLGMWLWVWDPGGSDGKGETFPAFETGTTNPNNYEINLSYYAPGVSQPDGSFGKSKVETITKRWTAPAAKKTPELNNYFDPQFSIFCDTSRAGVPPYATPNSQGFLAPDSQFPDVFALNPKGRHKDQQYPREGLSGGTCIPCWFGDMPDTSSSDSRTRARSTWEPFIYDSNPFITQGSNKGDDSYNFQPFRVTTTTPWRSGKNEMADYPFSGIVQQDARGPIRAGPVGKPPVEGVRPGIWTSGSESKTTIVTPPPPFQLLHECVLSKPYIPGATRHMFARTYTTVINEIPSGNVGGVDLTLKGGTFTYAGWARRLTDILNQVPPRRSAASGVGFNGLSNNPDNPKQPNNVPTYTTTRFLTDTIELGYQGMQFPSNRVGQGWQNSPNVKTVNPDGSYTASQTSKSEQPYWLAETGQDCFKWKDGVPQPNLESVDAATVDPAQGSQELIVYGQNGPKYAGAESFSIIFNEVAQAFEIVQMHSNMYSPSSGAIIIKQNRTAADFRSPYGTTMGDLNISDQTGGIFITDWQPSTIWNDKMNMNPNTLVHVGGSFNSGPNNFGRVESSFSDELKYPNMTSVSGHKVDLIPGLNITGNYLASTGLIDKRVNIPTDSTGTPKATDFIGGNYDSPEEQFNLQVETDTPVTILGQTITPSDIKDPFFMIEVSGINRNEIFGLNENNSLVSQVVGRYYSVGSYTEGNSDGSITYTHRGEDMLLSELGIRILDSSGNELDDDVLDGKSAVIIEINSMDVSLIDQSPP